MYLAMIVLVPVMILSVIGLQGESLFAFIGSFFWYVKRRRYLTVPDERYRMEQNRRKKKLQKEPVKRPQKNDSGKRKGTVVRRGTTKENRKR